MKIKALTTLPAILAIALPTSSAAQESKPNIVFILADDMGIGDLGCYGQEKILTPNIDALAESSLMFSHHYSGSTVSAPSRCCLLTGKHTGHSYVRGNKGVKTDNGSFDLHIPEEEVTVAEILKDQGYATACVGKWGLGGPHTSGSPVRQGFDYFYGYLSQGAAHRYYPEYLYENEEKVYLNGEKYSHFMIMEKGLEFISSHADQPFFAYFAVTPPHADLDYPDISAYEDSFPETPHINKSKDGKGYKTQLKPKAAYAAMVSEVDRNVGQIVSLLKEKGVWENTIVIFSSDNGVHMVGGHDPDFFNSNGPFRGYKRDLYDGGIRVPFIVSWPSVITQKRQTSHISTFWDLLPTICDITGAPAPKYTDGISYLPTLTGNGKQKKHRHLYYEFYEKGGKQAVIRNGWKLVRLNMSDPKKMKEELYNLNSDPKEENNIIKDHPGKASRLRRIAASSRTDSQHFTW